MVTSCQVMAVGAHPDDVELGCGGTLARLSRAGRAVGIVDLTAGEAATRGTAAVRRAEAAEASRRLGAAWRLCLELPDGAVASDDEPARRALVDVVRQATPHVVLVPHWLDPHPDHGAAFELARAACFLAGVGGFCPELGPPHRPQLLLAYPGPRQLLAPDLVIDVTASYPAKRAALAAHASQFGASGTPTHLASGHFLAAVEGRDRAAGNTVGAELGEGFVVLGPLSADTVCSLFGEGPCASA